jgi:hypothetical protein
MKLIQPNCRVQFAAEDVEFVLSILGGKMGTAECLVQLLSDEESRDLILDHNDLVRALLERGGCLRVSARFYFYILVRHAFRQAGLPDRSMADYVAEVLSEFARPERLRCAVPGQLSPTEYLFEMLTQLNAADDRTRFRIRVHIGNTALFLAGVFPERIRSRAESRGFPGLDYYEGLGRTQFRLASDHKLAQRYCLSSILNDLAENFGTTRLALNDLSERLFSIEPALSLEHLLPREAGAET